MKLSRLITAALMICGIAATTIVLPESKAEAGSGLCTQTGFVDMPCVYQSSAAGHEGDWYTKTVAELGIDITNYNFYNMNPQCVELCLPNPLGGQICSTGPKLRTTPSSNDYLGGNTNPKTYRLWCGTNANHSSGDHLHYRHK